MGTLICYVVIALAGLSVLGCDVLGGNNRNSSRNNGNSNRRRRSDFY